MVKNADIWLGVVGYIHVKQEAPSDLDTDSSTSFAKIQSDLIATENGSLLVQAAVIGNTGIFSPEFGTSKVLTGEDTGSASAPICLTSLGAYRLAAT